LALDGITVLVLDVDGVMTDGSITIDDHGVETKTFSVQDGHGLKLWHRSGHTSAIITGRESRVVERRAKELGVTCVLQGRKQKLPAFGEVCEHFGVTPAQVCYMGDDLPDLPPMRAAGLGVAVADAVPELRAEADYLTRRGGGNGAVREVIEMILKAQGKWAERMARYATGHPTDGQ